MATVNIWAGTSSFVANQMTPFALYDSDSTFQSDTTKVADWCARRLGYPIIDVELQSGSFFACFEEAVSEYGAQVNFMNIKNNLFQLKGQPSSSAVNQRDIKPSLNRIVELSEQYGVEAGVGGNVELKQGSITVSSASGQSYDLDTLYSDVSESGKAIEVRRVFYQGNPAISKYFDPYIGTGMGSNTMLDGFGFGEMTPAVNYLLLPMYDDLLRLQAIEFNDLIRKSSYSFQLINNKLKIFPKPTTTFNLYFDYYVKESKSPISGSRGVSEISDMSNINYQSMTYGKINEPGKNWIRKYTLALSKELLGSIRSKYGSLPGVKGDVSLDGDTLRTEGSTERDNLITQLREDLEATSRRNMMERENEIAQFQNEQLQKIPYGIYIG